MTETTYPFKLVENLEVGDIIEIRPYDQLLMQRLPTTVCVEAVGANLLWEAGAGNMAITYVVLETGERVADVPFGNLAAVKFLGASAMNTKRYYLVSVDTNAPEHKLAGIDQSVARQMHLGFGDIARVAQLDRSAVPESEMLLNPAVTLIPVDYKP